VFRSPDETESMSISVKTRKKLIEVALPLEAINIASAREKSIRHGHPSTLHLWWARRPLAAARAVIFSQMVDDPSSHPELFPSEEAQETERQRIFRILEKLVLWENTTNEAVLNEARQEIWKSWRSTCEDNRDHPQAAELFNPDKLPAFHDPFAGGGALPLEAQRLGLESYASDLNPVAVTINKAMIEIPPKFAGKPPVNPETRSKLDLIAREWRGAQGLAEDVRYYGKWMRDEAEKRIGNFYPKVEITDEVAQGRPDLKPYIGKQLTVVAWLWARTVKSPNPAFAHVDVPLASTFMLSTKEGKEAYVEPLIERDSYQFTVRMGKPTKVETAKNGTKLASGANFRCLMSDSTVEAKYIRSEAQAGRMDASLMAVVADGDHGRIYLSPQPGMEKIARSASPSWKPDLKVPTPCHDVDRLPMYGMPTWGDAFTSRQLIALTTLSDLVPETRNRVMQDAENAGLSNDSRGLGAGGLGASAYADAVGIYLGIIVDKATDYNSSFCGWIAGGETLRSTFGRQAISMNWDYCETNILGAATGSIESGFSQVAKTLDSMCVSAESGYAFQSDAQSVAISGRVVSTDPPYYDNISYADVSDFFYVWMRNSLKSFLPEIFATLAVPKAEELVATPYRHGSKEKAEAFFLDGMTHAMHRLAEQAHPVFPVTIYYAFKQAESDGADGTASTGWDTFLDAVIRAGFAITGTWPMRTERGSRAIGIGSNALASSIILVCRPCEPDAPIVTRREFVTALKTELPLALTHLQHGNIAPVDLAQAAIGPGMAVYTRYAKVLDAAGQPVTVRDALALINQTLDEALAEQEGDFDSDTRWAVAWFEQLGFEPGEYGVAETLSKAKNTSVTGMVDAGVLVSKSGKVRLLKPEELDANWEPETDTRKPVWEALHHLVRALNQGGETAAAALAARLGSRADAARELAYRLYILCERKKRAQEALAYNALVQSWPEIQRLASEQESRPVQPQQTSMFS
jgi:putative DNA methylase